MSITKNIEETLRAKKEREKKLDSLRQQKRRDLVSGRLGKLMPVHMKEKTKKRLELIFKKMALTRKEKNEAERRSTTIAELINQYYIDNILILEHETSVLTYEVYNRIWKGNLDEKTEGLIASQLNKEGVKIPYVDDISGKIVVEKGKWTREDIAKFSDTEKVIEMLESNEKKAK